MYRQFRLIRSMPAFLAIGVVLAFSSTASAGLWSKAVRVTRGPTLSMDPNGVTPLAGLVELETNIPVAVTLLIGDGVSRRTVRFPGLRRVHSLPVLGLEPDTTYTIDLRLGRGGPTVGPLFAVTDPLPQDFPIVEALVSMPERMEPGLTLLNCFGRDRDDPRPRYTMIVDARGRVVWYTTRCLGSEIHPLDNGNLLFLNGATVTEMDMLGADRRVTELQHPGENFHHEFEVTADGHYLSLSRKSVEVADYPTSETDPDAPTETAVIRDEPVLEFSRDGSLLNAWDLTAILQPTRISYGSLNEQAHGFDWGHANAVVHDPRDNSLIVSVRNQDAVVKFSRATGELVWILGPHDNWSSEFEPYLLHPVGSPFEWAYHQHASMVTPEGTLLLFDNGNRKVMPFDGKEPIPNEESYTRAVEYAIDEENMEVRQVWEYGSQASELIFARFLGDVDRLETTGNVLITFGAVSFTDGIESSALGRGSLHARIVEVDHDPIPEPVFDLVLFDPQGERVTVYRSERIRSLYPTRPGASSGDSGRRGRSGLASWLDRARSR